MLRHITAVVAALALLAGCASTPESETGGPASADRAERLQRQGNFTAAAQMYERLASQNPPPDNVTFSLAAARAWLSANRADDAQRTLDAITANPNPRQQFDRELLRAETATARGQYAAAWRQISAVTEPDNAADASRLFRLQQDVALRAGQPVEAVRAGLARDRVATSDAARATARRDLLSDLRGAIDRGLRVDPAAAREPLVRGWLEVGQIAASAGRSPLGAEPALERWRTRFPGHPAATIAYSDIVAPGARAPAANVAAVGGPVALLLPLTGAYAAQSESIRDGFQTAISRLPDATRPTVRIYDTGAMSVSAALQMAQGDGASFVVGPLTRPEVRQAIESRPGVLPMLLLNSLDGDGFAGAQVYQYPLAPEDEARQIARQLIAAGQRRAVLFSPAGDWGMRVATAFTDELVRGGGQVLAQGNYALEDDGQARNARTDMLTSKLGIDAGDSRLRRVQQITGLTLAFEPRPRADIDAIFVAGYKALTLREMNTQLLRFFSARNVPIYVTTDGLDADESGNRDLEDMRFVDMPWMLEATGPVADLRVATESVWNPRGKRMSRYFAFGYDAATVLTGLRGGQNSWPLPGVTGRLSLTPDGRVERSLGWARMHNGAPELFDPLR